MRTQTRRAASALAAGVLVAAAFAPPAAAQAPSPSPTDPRQLPTEVSNVRFNAGQSVVPYFEGWIKNPDGSFDLVFGYFNRNWKEELVIPPGPDNKIEPVASADMGQPTYFVPRRQRWVFRYKVPADFGKKTVTWTLTANGRTEKAYGDLLPAQELTERVVMTNGNFNPGEGDPNQPPKITVAPVQNVAAGTPTTLTASIADDGLPKPRVVAPTPPPAPTAGGRILAQTNSAGQRPRGLTVSWLPYRGPAKVTLADGGPTAVTLGQPATTTATFAAPGAYVLRATANDGSLSKRIEITVTVTGTAQTQGQQP